MQQIKILLIEDDELASELIYEYLIDTGFSVKPVFTATDGVSYLKNEHFDLALLDINLPDFTGYEVLKSIKTELSIPIIITSAYNDTKSKLLAFKYGASDYMVKPLDLEELEARIWLQLGKTSEIATKTEKRLIFIENDIIYFDNKPLPLTTLEFEILEILLKNSNRVVKRDDIIDELSSIGSQRSLDNHIKNIRKKLGDNGNNAKYLKTQYGVGYILDI